VRDSPYKEYFLSSDYQLQKLSLGRSDRCPKQADSKVNIDERLM